MQQSDSEADNEAPPEAGHRGGAFFGVPKRTTSRQPTSKPNAIKYHEYPRAPQHAAFYTDGDVRREVFNAENGPEKMRTLAQAEKDMFSYRDITHAFQSCMASASLLPDPTDREKASENCAEMFKHLPAAADAWQAELQNLHDQIDEKYKIPTTRSAAGMIVEECSMPAQSAAHEQAVDVLSATPGAAERYREACAALKDALMKVDIAVEQNRKGTYVRR